MTPEEMGKEDNDAAPIVGDALVHGDYRGTARGVSRSGDDAMSEQLDIVTQATDYLNLYAALPEDLADRLLARIQSLTEERDGLRTALERISDEGCAFDRITARQALTTSEESR